jgi:hypothetical protein
MNEQEELPWIVPLYNFDSDIESTGLSETICLRRKRSNDLPQDIIEEISGDPLFKLETSNVKYMLEGYTKNFPNLTREILLSLRLLKTGDVQAFNAIRLKKNKGFTLISKPHPLVVFSNRRYFLSKKETTAFKRLWKKVQNVASKPYLDFSLKMFTATYEEKIPEDKIVDYMTAFESIVFYDRDKAIEPAGEVMGIVLGMMLGNTQQERYEIKKTFVKAYDVRNARVHGNVRKLKNLKAQNGIGETSIIVEDYLRNALRKFVEE